MLRKILWGGLAGALLLLGGVGYGIVVYPQQQARAAVAAAFARLPAGWSGRYGAPDYGLVERQIVIGDLALERGATRIAIAHLTLTGVDGDSGRGSLLHAREATLDGFSLTAADGSTASVAQAAASEVAVDLASLGQTLGRDDAAPALFVLPRFASAATLTATSYRGTAGKRTDEIAALTAEAVGHGAIGTIVLAD
jgi:hypothetical protein